MSIAACSVAGCTRGGRIAAGYCMLHYQRVRKHGDPSITKVPRHGLDTESSEYRAWVEMRRRCSKTDRPSRNSYIGRGITVCERWNNSYPSFLEDMGPRPSTLHSIDRINNDGNYEPGNCRWATQKEQGNNRRTNHFVVINGVSKTIQQWCDEYGLPDTTFHNRLRRGVTGERLISKEALNLERVGLSRHSK